MAITADQLKSFAHECGFELVGIAQALPLEDFTRFNEWRDAGMAGEMTYLTDRRGDLRSDPLNLLPSAKSIVCVGKLYNTDHPISTAVNEPVSGWISRYAWGDTDYHDILKALLQKLLQKVAQAHAEPFEARICVDTAPLLERSYAQAAGLGWIGKNTCLINQEKGSWFFLGELLLSIPLAPDQAPPDRCGSCRRCIDACPTDAIVPTSSGGWQIDARNCISYLTIEKRGPLSEEAASQITNHLFGCDICQDVCPWNRKAPVTGDSFFGPVYFSPSLEGFACLSEEDFRRLFRKSPVWRTKYEGFLRNVAITMGNSANPGFAEPLKRLAQHSNRVIASAALSSLQKLALLILAVFLCHAAEDPLKNPGFVHFYNNEFPEAVAVFEKDIQANPNDPENYNHLAQAILYQEMFRDGALESELVTGSNPFLRRSKMEIDPASKKSFTDSVSRSLSLTAAILQKNPNDVPALYASGVAHGLRANYLFLVEKAWLDALRDATAARKEDEAIFRLDPKFVDAHLLLGLGHYIVGCLPFYLRALGAADGYHGDKKRGLQELQEIAKKGISNRYDAQVLLAAIYRRERTPSEAIPLLKSLSSTFPRNYLFRLEQVQMYSDLGDKQAALQVLSQVEQLRREKSPGYAELAVQKVEYLRGNLLFWYGDLDPALSDLQRVTQKADEIDLSTAVMAWLRLGQVYDLRGDHKSAVNAYGETLKVAPKSEAAVEAKGYISNPYRRKRQNG